MIYTVRQNIKFFKISKEENAVKIKYGRLLAEDAEIVERLKSGKTVWMIGLPWNIGQLT